MILAERTFSVSCRTRACCPLPCTFENWKPTKSEDIVLIGDGLEGLVMSISNDPPLNLGRDRKDL
jgi:hypothetical protein